VVSGEAILTLVATLVVVAAVGAALLLRGAWKDRTATRPWRIVGGWLLIAAVLVLPGFALGPARGPFIALALVSVAALAVVIQGVQIRQARGRGDKSLAPEPSDRPSKVWRGWLRWLLAGPIGFVAAMGVAICYAVWMPGAAQTRLVIGGLMVPVLWGGAMAWTLADDKILRATAVLVGVSLVTFTASILRGFS
jgi:hypothetical protein